MKKRILFLWVLLLSTTVCTFAYSFKSGDLYYATTSGSTVEVVSNHYYNYNYLGLTSAVIPESVTYDGTTYSVTSIGGEAFKGCSSLTSITIPNSITSIGDDAFRDVPWYYSLPDGMVYINRILYAYKGTMPQGTNIIVKEGTTSICSGAFKDCTGLTSITLLSQIVLRVLETVLSKIAPV